MDIVDLCIFINLRPVKKYIFVKYRKMISSNKKVILSNIENLFQFLFESEQLFGPDFFFHAIKITFFSVNNIIEDYPPKWKTKKQKQRIITKPIK